MQDCNKAKHEAPRAAVGINTDVTDGAIAPAATPTLRKASRRVSTRLSQACRDGIALNSTGYGC